MHMAGTPLTSLAVDSRAPQRTPLVGVADAEASTNAEEPLKGDDTGAGEQLEQSDGGQVALAVCQQVSGAELTLAAVPPAPAVARDPVAFFEDEFRDFELTISRLARLSPHASSRRPEVRWSSGWPAEATTRPRSRQDWWPRGSETWWIPGYASIATSAFWCVRWDRRGPSSAPSTGSAFRSW